MNQLYVSCRLDLNPVAIRDVDQVKHMTDDLSAFLADQRDLHKKKARIRSQTSSEAVRLEGKSA
jgi:hypothetical protein